MGKIEETTTDNKTKGAVLKTQCIRCHSKTKHIVLQSYEREGKEIFYEDKYWIGWSDDYQIIQCQGCDEVSFRHLNWFSEYQEYYGPNDYYDGTRERLYPVRSQNTVPTKDFINLPPALRRIYIETINCFNNEHYTLAAAGLRAIVEGVCAEQKVTSGLVGKKKNDGTIIKTSKDNLEGKISGLHEKGILTKNHSEILHEHRFLGNEALHELTQPSYQELRLAIEILEHTLEQLYEIPEKAIKLKNKKIARTKR